MSNKNLNDKSEYQLSYSIYFNYYFIALRKFAKKKFGIMNKKKLIIFDFDGTIADTLYLGFQIAQDLADDYHFRKFDKSEIKDLRELSTHEILKKMGISLMKVPFLAVQFQRELSKRIEELNPINGMIEILNKIDTFKVKLGIVTSNSKENVEKFLQNNQIQNLFSFIHSERNIFGKAHVLKKTLREQKYQPSEVFYVGDETRDIDSSKKAHISIIAVGWGFNSKNALLKHDPEYFAASPDELFTQINSLI